MSIASPEVLCDMQLVSFKCAAARAPSMKRRNVTAMDHLGPFWSDMRPEFETSVSPMKYHLLAPPQLLFSPYIEGQMFRYLMV